MPNNQHSEEQVAETLLVPMQVQALLVGKPLKKRWKDLKPDYSEMLKHKTRMQEAAYPSEFNGLKGQIHNPGIHLHWVLPSAFRHGIQKQKNSRPVYPFIPNRWIVTRMFVSKGKEKPEFNTKSWVIESDAITGEGTANWVKLSSEETQFKVGDRFIPMSIGRVTPLEKWTGSSKKGKKPFLTIMGPGDPTFAASYSSCQGVLGFHDDMMENDKSLPKGDYAYLVVGWHASEEADILAGIDDIVAWKNTLDEYGWEPCLPGLPESDFPLPDQPFRIVYPVQYKMPDNKTITCRNEADINYEFAAWRKKEPNPTAKPELQYPVWIVGKDVADKDVEESKVEISQPPAFPTRSLCHAMVHSVDWKGKDHIYPIFSGEDDIDVGIGNSATEALAVLSRRKFSGTEATTRKYFSSVFQYSQLAGADPMMGLEAMKSQFHKNSFIPHEGGDRWVIEKEARKDLEKETGKDIPFPVDLSRLLKELNEAQASYDQLSRELSALRWRLYARWFQVPKSEDAQGLNEIKKQIEEKEGALKNEGTASPGSIPKTQKALQEEIQAFNKDIARDQKEKTFDRQYILRKEKMPRFYQAKEPALVFSGINTSDLYQDEGTLACRTANQLVARIEFSRINEPSKVSVAAELLAIASPDHKHVPPEAGLLFQEALLFNPEMTPLIGAKINVEEEELRSSLAKDIREKINEFNSEDFRKKEGKPVILPSKKAVAAWHQPWVPLFLEWSIKRYPLINPQGADAVTAYWDFGQEKDPKKGLATCTDFELKEKEPTKDTIAKVIARHMGRVLLSGDLRKSIAQLLDKFPRMEEGNYFKDWAPISQSLAGLNDQLIHRKSNFQFPPLEEGKSVYQIDSLIDTIKDQYLLRPMVKAKRFSPIRGGHFTLDNLRVIDAFGQVKQIALKGSSEGPSPIHVAAALPSYTIGKEKYIQLRPRLTQPARLLFKWLAAAEEMSGREMDSDPATSPVCGWLLPNRLDHSLMIYDADGNYCGALKLTGGENNPHLKTVLAPTHAPGTELGSVIKNKYLKAIVLRLIDKDKNPEDSAKVLRDFLDLADAVGHKVNPSVSNHGLMMPIAMGNPIAVVRASLKLELASLPAENQQLEAENTSEHAFMQVKFPVKIGHFYQKKDGLFGFFEPGENDFNFETMTLPFGYDYDHRLTDASFFKREQSIQLSLAEEPKELILLIDPRASLQLRTGILPLQERALPAAMVSYTLRQMEVGFSVYSLLSPRQTLQLPLAKLPDSEWHWFTKPDKGESSWEQQSPSDEIAGQLSFDPLQLKEGWLGVKEILKKEQEGNEQA